MQTTPIHSPAVNYYGGKQRMLPHILPLIPPHRVYRELFAGGLSVFFAKKPAPVEGINDINGNVCNFYKVMKHNFDELNFMIENTLHCEYTHTQSKNIYHNPNNYTEVQRAHAFWVACNLSFAAECAGSFQHVHNKSDNWSPPIRTTNKKNVFKSLKHRLEKTTIYDSEDAVELLLKLDNEDTFTYLDPPYVGARQGHYSGYTQTNFNDLISGLINHKGKFLLSSYQNDNLSYLVKEAGWNQIEINQQLGVQSGRKTEILTFNYELKECNKTLSLFN